MSPQVWLEAATQIFFSLGVSTGALIALSSYTKPHYNALTDSLIVCLTNSATSIFSSIVVFSVIGFKAKQTNIDLVNELVRVHVYNVHDNQARQRYTALGGIRTHDTLRSRQVLYQLSYQGSSAG